MSNSIAAFRFKILFRLFQRINSVLLRAVDKSAKQYIREKSGKEVFFFTTDKLQCDKAKRWEKIPVSVDALTIIVVTYKQPDALRCLLDSFVCQTLQNFKVLVLHDGVDILTRNVVESFQARSFGKYSYEETTKRFNDYGHSLRALAIRKTSTAFVLITNGDNYYGPRTIEMAFEMLIDKKLDIVMWDMVHSHANPGTTKSEPYRNFSVYPIRNFIDIGSFIARTDLAKAAGFRDLSHDGDATYFEDVLSFAGQTARIGKINKTLMIHN